MMSWKKHAEKRQSNETNHWRGLIRHVFRKGEVAEIALD